MSLRGARNSSVARLRNYGLSLAVVAAAVLLRWQMAGVLGGTPYLAFYPAVVAAAVFAGAGPGVLATVLSALCVALLFDPMPGWDNLDEPAVWVRLGLFLLGGVGTSVAAGSMKRHADALWRSEEQHRATAEDLQALMDAVPGGICVAHDEHCRHVTGNRLANALLGVPIGANFSATPEASEPSASTHFQLRRDGQKLSVEQLPMQVVCSTGKALHNEELEIIRRDGSRRFVLLNAAPLHRADGSIRGVVAAFTDITQRKLAEQALRDGEQQVRRKLDALLAPEGDLGELALADIIDVPATQALMDEFHKLTGFPMSIIDLQGKVLVGVGWQEICLHFHRVHPETCRHCLESDMQLTSGLVPGQFRLYQCKNHMWDVATPIMIGGKHVGNLFSGQFFFDDEVVDRELFRTQARQYGFDPEAYLAALERVPRLSREKVTAGMAFLMRLSERLSLLSYSNIQLARSSEALIAAKTSAERAKLAAEEANRAKDQFLAVLSHELRTPLTPVVTAVSMLQAQLQDEPMVRETLEMVRRNVEMEARLIDDLLDVTRIVRGKIELDRQPIRLCEVIGRSVEVCKPDLDGRQLHFGVDIGDAAPYEIDADAGRLQQVFWNLLKNAVKFTPHGGCVGIRCRRDGDCVVTEVIDSGEGIEPHLLPHIFNPFEQGGARVTRQFGGLGLGLTITKGLVEMHGGTIEAHSDGKGKGATFRVRLPIHVASRPVVAKADQNAAPAAEVPSLRILLVEDHGDTARVMRQLLVRHGHQVEMAGDVATALKLAQEHAFDLLVSDLGLPDGSGVDLMRELRAHGRALPAIALSGYGQDEDVRRSREAGFITHLIKPTSPDQLIRAIGGVAGHGRAG